VGMFQFSNDNNETASAPALIADFSVDAPTGGGFSFTFDPAFVFVIGDAWYWRINATAVVAPRLRIGELGIRMKPIGRRPA
jgi:hypothetical protein